MWKTNKSQALPAPHMMLKIQYDYETDEFRVAVFHKGVLNEAQTYYTDSEADAIGTMSYMIKEFTQKEVI